MFTPNRRKSRVVRCLMIALIVFAMTLPAVPLGAAPIGGTLTGRVVMKTAGASLPTTPLTATLLYFNPGLFRATDEAADSRMTMTAPDGSFTFAGLDPSQAGVYRVMVNYKGVAYEPAEQDVTDPVSGAHKSRAVRFASNATSVATEVPIYEPIVGESPTNFAIKSHQIIMNEVRPQFYSVLEALQITNPGDRTLVGALNPDGSVMQGAPLVFSAPSGAQSISTNRIDLIAGADLTGQKLTLRMPIPPGSSDMTATYDIPGSPSGFTYTRTLDYAAAKLQVLVSDSRQALASQTLHSDGPIQAPQGATPFRQFSADNVQAGQTYALLIGPSPAAPPPGATAAKPAKSTWDRIRERGTVPFLLVLAVICLALMFLILRAPVRAPASGAGTTRASDGANVSPPTGPDATEVGAPSSVAVGGTGRNRGSRNGRPRDDDLDDAERAIEEANRPDDEAAGTART